MCAQDTASASASAYPGGDNVNARRGMINFLILDTLPPEALSGAECATHSQNLKNAFNAFLEWLFDVRSTLQQRDPFEVMLCRRQSNAESAGECVRVMPITESQALRDPRNKRSAKGHVHLALNTYARAQRYDAQLYASALASEVVAYVNGKSGNAGSTLVKMVTLVCSISVAEHLVCHPVFMRATEEERRQSLSPSRGFCRFRILALGPSSESHKGALAACVGDAEKYMCHYLLNDSNSISRAMRSVLGDILESNILLRIPERGNKVVAVELQLRARPRVLCTVGTAYIYNCRVAIPNEITLWGVRRILVDSLCEDILYGVAYILTVNTLDACVHENCANFTQIVSSLRFSQEALLVRIEGPPPFIQRFGVLLPSRGPQQRDALLLRDVACTNTLLPLSITASSNGSGSLDTTNAQCELADPIRHLPVQPYQPPV